MRRLRDVFYVNGYFEENHYFYYGMEFKEFIKYCPDKLENILITDGGYLAASGFNYEWWMETAQGNADIQELAREDIYGQGNFHWIDFKSEDDLNGCTPQEKAEVLYLSHFGTPVAAPFFDSIGNNFVYLAHDDGWVCKLYCRSMGIMKDIIGNKIVDAISTNKRRIIAPMDEDIKVQLLEMTREGLLVDLSEIFVHNSRINIRVYSIGKYRDMDAMYNELSVHKARAKCSGYLEHYKKKWTLELNYK